MDTRAAGRPPPACGEEATHPLRCGPGPLRMPCSGLRQGRDLPQLWPLWGAPCCDFTRRPQSPTAPALLEARRLRLAPPPGVLGNLSSLVPPAGAVEGIFLPRSDSTWPSWVDLNFIPGFCTAMASFLRMGLWGVMLSSETPRTHGCRSSGCGCSRDKNRSTNHAELLWLGGRPAGVSSVVVELLVARQSLQCRCENLMAGTWPGPSQASPGTVALPPCSPLTSRLLTCLVAASLLATSDLRWEALNQAVFRPKMSPRPTSVSACVCRDAERRQAELRARASGCL